MTTDPTNTNGADTDVEDQWSRSEDEGEAVQPPTTQKHPMEVDQPEGERAGDTTYTAKAKCGKRTGSITLII
eukprot:15341710-Ditylum_brightwellii.AAC.1